MKHLGEIEKDLE